MSNKNNASKITPAVGMILFNSKSSPAKVLTVDNERGKVSVFRPGARVRWTTIAFASLDRYHVASETDFQGVDFSETDGGRSGLTDAPPPPPASEPAPQPTPAPAANDNTLAIYTAQFIEAQRSANERMDKLENLVVTVLGTVADLVKHQTANAQPAPSAKDAKAEKDERLKAEHKKKFQPLLEEFVRSELDRIDPASVGGRERALESGKVYSLFAAWCEKNKKADEKPYQHAIYSLLNNNPHRGEFKVIGKADKVLTAYALKNKKQTAFKFSEPTTDTIKSLTADLDAREVFEFARVKVWPNISETHIATITALLDGFTKDQLLTALGNLAKPIPGSRAYLPSEILTPATMRAILTRAVRPLGVAK